MSDTKKLRQAFKDAGFLQRNPCLPTVFNDKHKGGTRRLKLWDGDHVFAAPVFAQEELDRQFKVQFGARYLFGEFIAWNSQRGYSDRKSLVIYLLD